LTKLPVILILSLFSLKGLAASTPVPNFDAVFPCFSQAVADRFVDELHIDIASFGGTNLCDNKTDSKKILNDLQITQEGQFNKTIKNVLIDGFVPSDQYYPWLRSEIHGVRRGQDLPYASAYNSGGYLSIQDDWGRLPTLGRVGVIIHEARHTEGYFHIQCNFGPYSSSTILGCDGNFLEGGSHAVEMEYYARVVEAGTNFHPVYQAMARMMAMSRANFVFNENPLKKTDTLAMVTTDNRGMFFDGKNLTHRPILLPNQSFKLKTTSFGASIFDGINAWAFDI